MSSSAIEIRKFQKTLKRLIFGKGLRYQDMAEALSISISTAKRLLNRDDLSLQNMASPYHYKFLKLLLRGLTPKDIMDQEQLSVVKAWRYLKDL